MVIIVPFDYFVHRDEGLRNLTLHVFSTNLYWKNNSFVGVPNLISKPSVGMSSLETFTELFICNFLFY